MKQRILSLLVLLMTAVTGAMAQTETLADGSYYVKNVALSLYMAAGGNWGTQGIVNERGLDLIFTYNSGTKTYTIDSRLNNGDNHFLDTGLHMDAPSFGWTVEGENSFTISATLDGVKHYLAVDQNNKLVFTEDGTAENAQWTIIPKADNENAVLTAGLDAMKAATAENGVDATFLIACPGFNRNDNRNAEAWTVEANRLQMGGAGSEGNGCAESYNSTFTLSQTLSNAPAGVYTLTAQGFYKQNGSDNENLPYFYANDEKQTFKLLEDQAYNMSDAGPLFTQGKYTIDPITVVVAEDGALTIGAKLETNTTLWSCWDNFKLTYYGPLMYSVTLADGTGTISYTVQDKYDAEKITENAKVVNEGDLVTVTVTADEGYVVGSVTATTYTTWDAAGARRRSAPDNIQILGDVTLTPVEGKANTWTFTMPAASVLVSAGYIKSSTLYFDPADKTNLVKVTVDGTDRNLNGSKTVKIKRVDNVLEGTAVTLTANQGYKFRKVQVTKTDNGLKLTNPTVGQVIGSDGKNYAYASLPTGVTAVAKICYVSGNSGLALALADESSMMDWATAIETCAAHTPAFKGAEWKLASQDEWNNMKSAAGNYANLRNGFSSVGGTDMRALQEETYWSSTEQVNSQNAWYMLNSGNWYRHDKSVTKYVRACLAF